MGTKRTRLARHEGVKITPQVIEAYRAGDYKALHLALRLGVWETSPLPLEICELGCDYGPKPEYENNGSWEKAVALRRQIEEAIRAD